MLLIQACLNPRWSLQHTCSLGDCLRAGEGTAVKVRSSSSSAPHGRAPSGSAPYGRHSGAALYGGPSGSGQHGKPSSGSAAPAHTHIAECASCKRGGLSFFHCRVLEQHEAATEVSPGTSPRTMPGSMKDIGAQRRERGPIPGSQATCKVLYTYVF